MTRVTEITSNTYVWSPFVAVYALSVLPAVTIWC